MDAPALDPRIHAVRPDLADARLRGRVTAARFADGRPARVVTETAPVHGRPDPAAPWTSELLFGETVDVFEKAAGWAWCQNRADSYVGYVPAACLAEGEGAASTHVVAVPRTLVFPEPSIKAPSRLALSLGTRVRATVHDATFLALDDGFVIARHLAPAGETEPDLAATALRFLGVPYRWGGRSALGLDCSALIQLAADRAGHACPRDSDLQAESLGREVARAAAFLDPAALDLRRGDLLFSPGHVVIQAGGGEIVHANAWHMAVAREPLAALAARLAARGEGFTCQRRLEGACPTAPT